MKTINPDKVIKIVLDHYGKTFEQITANRKGENIDVKQQIMFFMRKYCKYRLKKNRLIKKITRQKVAKLLGLTNHATIIHGEKTIQNLIDSNDPIISDIINIEEIILDNLEFEYSETELQYVTRKMNYYNKRYENLVEDLEVDYQLVKAS